MRHVLLPTRRPFYGLPTTAAQPLQKWATTLRLRRDTGVDVGPEASGLVPTIGWRKRTYTQKTDPSGWQIDSLWKPGDSIQLAIGQKDLLVTPLQMARFYALIANGGKLVTPHVLMDVENPNRHARCRSPRRRAAAADRRRPGRARGRPAGPLGGDAPQLRDVVRRLRQLPGLDRRQDRHGGEGRHAARLHRRSRTSPGGAATGRPTTPKIVVCAVIENGGHGGTAAAPAALKVFAKFFHVKAQLAAPIHSD